MARASYTCQISFSVYSIEFRSSSDVITKNTIASSFRVAMVSLKSFRYLITVSTASTLGVN